MERNGACFYSLTVTERRIYGCSASATNRTIYKSHEKKSRICTLSCVCMEAGYGPNLSNIISKAEHFISS